MRYIVIAMVMVLTCLELSTTQASDTSDARESLRGLPGVRVSIERTNAEAVTDGLSKESIQTAVETILRSNGIRVLTESDWLNTPSGPFFHVEVTAGKSEHIYVYCINHRLVQRVALVHIPAHTMFAATWSDGSTGVTSENNLRNVISLIVEQTVKRFVNDFLTVNPR